MECPTAKNIRRPLRNDARAGRRWRGSAAAHRGQGQYLLYHATWHWWGAACVCAVTAKVQLRQDVPGD